MTPAWVELEKRASALSSAGSFEPLMLESLPEPVPRYLRTSIQEGTPLAVGARLSMVGRIKIGRWLPFRAHQLLVPSLGTVWKARVAGVIGGSDRYVGGPAPWAGRSSAPPDSSTHPVLTWPAAPPSEPPVSRSGCPPRWHDSTR
jgi:hypothetical protein